VRSGAAKISPVCFVREIVCGVDLADVGAGNGTGGEAEVEAADILRES